MATDGVEIVLPGDIVGSTREWEAADGTYVMGKDIRASTVGVLRKVTYEASDAAADASVKGKLQVTRSGNKGRAAVIPQVGSTVIGKILRITPMYASIDILVVNGQAVDEAFNGIIRKEHIRETEIDKIKMDECFRPGDIVQAVVASLGDARSYLLSTAKPEYGVIYATSEAGDLMVPINYEEMEAPTTRIRERRKCARPAL